MLRKSIASCFILAGFLQASAWDNMYLVGDGTVAGYSYDHFLSLNSIGDQVWATVAYLDVKDGRSFRFQPDKDWKSENYYGASENKQIIDNNQTMSLTRGTDNHFTVATPGVYYIEAKTTDTEAYVKINRMGSLYAVGSFLGCEWSLGGNEMKNSAENPSIYVGDFEVGLEKDGRDGSFKFEIDNNGDWANRYFLFRDHKGQFKKAATGDDKWSVGYPDQATHAEKDLDPGKYRFIVNAADKKVSYQRLLRSVNAVETEFAVDGQNYVGRHIYIPAGYQFKVWVDNEKLYGYDQWYDVAMSDNTDYYLRQIDNGANLSVANAGFRDVTVFPSASNDGTIGIRVSAPQEVYYDGYGIIEPKDGYYGNSSYKWMPASTSLAVKIGDDKIGEVMTSDPGWYNATITFDGTKPSYNFHNNLPSITGDAMGLISFSVADLDGESYLKNLVFARSGANYTLHLGEYSISYPALETGGYYSVRVNLTQEGTPQATLEPLSAWIEGYGELSFDNNDSQYLNKDVKWLDRGATFKFMAGGQQFGSATANESGWYHAYVRFDNNEPNPLLIKLVPCLKGDACGEVKFDSQSEVSGQSYVKNNVYFEAGKPYSLSIGDETVEYPAVEKSGNYRVKVNLTTEGRPQATLVGPIEVNMPLKEEDFVGQTHYFLVGQRTAAWRLQPEWEFVYDNGSYVIPTRLLYNGYVMIAAVDNYDDYVSQTYRGFTATDASSVLDPSKAVSDRDFSFGLKSLNANAANGAADGKFTCLRYDDVDRTSPAVQHGSWDMLDSQAISILSSEGWTGKDNMQGGASRVNAIRLEIDSDGNPTRVVFEGVNSSTLEVAKQMTFSLVGGGIGNSDVVYDHSGVTTSLNRQPGYGGDKWADSWIQYDSKGKPYVDANGDYVYQTSFTENWLRQHPSYFNFGDHFKYTSNNLTFFYDADETHPDQFGQRTFFVDNVERQEKLYTYASIPTDFSIPANELRGRNAEAVTDLNDRIDVEAAKRVCYVVEDMWMEGMFKVWSGWGGASTNYESCENGTNYTRWYRDNAGHGAWREDRTAFYLANTQMAFTLFEDIDAANFGIGYGLPGSEKVDDEGRIKDAYKEQPERRFFKRVEIWFNLDTDFAYKGKTSASFLVFKQEQGGPSISIEKHNDSQIKYNYELPLINGMPVDEDHKTFGNVTYYRVERIALDENGRESEPVLVYEQHDVNSHRDDFHDYDVVDPTNLSEGRYRYQITTRRENTGAQEFSAKSNIVRIDGDLTQTGVEDVVDGGSDIRMSIFPNPATDVVNLRSEAIIGEVRIFSTNGSLVKTVDVDDTQAAISVADLASGLYIVRSGDFSTRLIKK